MHSQFFPKNDKSVTENNFQYFLENYPEKEFWRFFVERDRYDRRAYLFRMLHKSWNNLTEDEAKKVSVEEIEENVSSLSVEELYQFAEAKNDKLLIFRLDNTFRLKDRKTENIVDVINRNQGWIGFEDNEPGYLTSITNAFNFILKNAADKRKLDLEFIRKIHELATQNVKNMSKGTMPGEFRQRDVGWDITKSADSLEGLKETIDYLKTVEYEWDNAGLCIRVKDENNKRVENFTTFMGEDTTAFADKIWSLVNEGEKKEVYFWTTDRKKIDTSKDFLTTVTNKHLNNLDCNLILAKSKEEKLTAIFTFLKYTVLHHVFADGVGRSFSMLLLQYLLLRENLLPVLIKDSNIIPGYSVKELVDEYLRAEKEMQLILKDAEYINSKNIVEENVNTDQLLKNLPQQEQDMFVANVDEYRKTKAECLLPLVNLSTSPTNSG